VQTGVGRTGAWFAHQGVGVVPDVITLAKGLGGGLPISACIASDEVMQAWAREEEVVHTSTHAGAPLACATAIATLDSLRFRQLVTKARDAGTRTKEYLRAVLAGVPGVVEVRGEGLMLGIALESGALALAATRRLLEAGYIVVPGGQKGEVLTWTPPLTISEEQLTAAANATKEALL